MVGVLRDLWISSAWTMLAGTLAGVIVLALPLLLSRRFRRWFDRNDACLETIGLAALLLALVAIGIHNTVGQ